MHPRGDTVSRSELLAPMRVALPIARPYRLVLALGVILVGVIAAALTARYWLPLPLPDPASPADAPLSLHVVAMLMLTVSCFCMAGACVSMYFKLRGLLDLRSIFLVFALFVAAVGCALALELLALANREFRFQPRFQSQGEMLTAILAAICAGVLPAMAGRIREFLVAMRQSQRSEARLLAASESSLEALYILQSVRGQNAQDGHDGQIVDFKLTYINSKGEKLVGLPRQAILGQHLRALIPAARTGGFFEEYRQVAMSGEPVVREFPMQLEDGLPRWIRHEVVRLEDGIAITAADITDRKLSEQATEHRAQHDVLTGLPNRSLLHDRTQQAIDRAIRYRNRVALFVVDMDRFKEINDTLGHAAGDVVLMTVAQRLRDSVRGSDSVLRIGGDEFIVVMPDVQEERDIRRVAAKITSAILNGGPEGLDKVTMSCSIGIAIYPSQAITTEELFSRADAAMYEAKRRGGGCFEVYNEATPGFTPQMPPPPPTRKARGARPALVVPRPAKSSSTFPEA